MCNECENTERYPLCEIKTCLFCGCMMDNTCKVENVVENAPWLIIEFADSIKYCDRPKIFKNRIGGML